jgi:hypothetical protein
MGNLFCAPASEYVLLRVEEPVLPLVLHDEFYIMDAPAAEALTGVEIPEPFSAVLFHFRQTEPGSARTDAAYGLAPRDLQTISPDMRHLPPDMVSSDEWAERNSKFYNVRCNGMFKGIRYFPAGLLSHLAPLDLPPTLLFL